MSFTSKLLAQNICLRLQPAKLKRIRMLRNSKELMFYMARFYKRAVGIEIVGKSETFEHAESTEIDIQRIG